MQKTFLIAAAATTTATTTTTTTTTTTSAAATPYTCERYFRRAAPAPASRQKWRRDCFHQSRDCRPHELERSLAPHLSYSGASTPLCSCFASSQRSQRLCDSARPHRPVRQRKILKRHVAFLTASLLGVYRKLWAARSWTISLSCHIKIKKRNLDNNSSNSATGLFREFIQAFYRKIETAPQAEKIQNTADRFS